MGGGGFSALVLECGSWAMVQGAGGEGVCVWGGLTEAEERLGCLSGHSVSRCVVCECECVCVRVRAGVCVCVRVCLEMGG